MRNTQYIRVGDILCPVRLYAGGASYITFNIERPEVNTMAQNYLRISSITVLIMFMNLLFTAIIDAHGKTQFSFRAVLYGNIVNIILDPLFIFISDWEWKVRHGLRHFHRGVP